MWTDGEHNKISKLLCTDYKQVWLPAGTFTGLCLCHEAFTRQWRF